jgi:hypothetical protein
VTLCPRPNRFKLFRRNLETSITGSRPRIRTSRSKSTRTWPKKIELRKTKRTTRSDVEQKFTYKPTVTVTADDAWDDVSIFPSDVTYAEWSNLEANVQNTYTLTYTQNDYETMRYEKTTVSNVTAEDAWDAVHIEPPGVTYAEYSNLEANVQNTYTLTYTKSVTMATTPAYYSNLAPEEQNTYSHSCTRKPSRKMSRRVRKVRTHTSVRSIRRSNAKIPRKSVTMRNGSSTFAKNR